MPEPKHSAPPAKHEFAGWSPQDGMYAVKCSCGWWGFTFASTPETSIQSTWEVHAHGIG